MEIALLVIVCITFIALSIGLYLNHKNSLIISAKITASQDHVIQDIARLKNEMNEKIQQLRGDTYSRIDASKNECISTINSGMQKIESEIVESGKNLRDSISQSKSETVSSILSALNSVREDLLAAQQKLQKDMVSSHGDMKDQFHVAFNKMQHEIDAQITNSIFKQNEFSLDVNNKFNKIIDEIKSPLTLD